MVLHNHLRRSQYVPSQLANYLSIRVATSIASLSY